MPVSIAHYYAIVIASLETHQGPFPVSAEVYHDLPAQIREILDNVFIIPVPEEVIIILDEMISLTVANRFRRFLNNVQSGIMNARPREIHDTLCEWIRLDTLANLQMGNMEMCHIYWACEEFMRTHAPFTDEEMESVNATVARVYGDILTGQLGNSTDVIAAMRATFAATTATFV